MALPPPNSSRLKPLWRALIEIGFIIFLFYANLLMGEFTRTNGVGRTLSFAVRDIFTIPNFIIANIAACIGYGVFEFLRKKL
jgi:hypothetical protein